jgi:4,5-DOPA dioxygenase extradiol
MPTLPSLFLAHGAPDLVLTEHPTRRFLEGVGSALPRPLGILVVSAHWEALRPTVTSAVAPSTVHDFSGWPQPLYALRYPARTSAALVARVGQLMRGAGLPLDEDPRQGYDHGAWVPLMLSHPQADVPVVQMSLELDADARRHFRIGEALAALRDEGVLVVGSGATVHNLGTMAPEGSPPPAFAAAFDRWLEAHLEARDLDALLSFPAAPPEARIAHPTSEHFLPLYVALGAGWAGGRSRVLHGSYSYGSIGMACHAFGGAETDELFSLAAA